MLACGPFLKNGILTLTSFVALQCQWRSSLAETGKVDVHNDSCPARNFFPTMFSSPLIRLTRSYRVMTWPYTALFCSFYREVGGGNK